MPSIKTMLKTGAIALVAIAIVTRVEPARKVVFNQGG